jgi:hypothetical protein
MKKILLYLFLSFCLLSNNSISAINNSEVIENIGIKSDSIHKTAQDYYDEAAEHEKEAAEHSKRGFIVLMISIGLLTISRVARKKKNR